MPALNRAITDNRNPTTRLPAHFISNGKTQGGANRGRTMGRAKGIIFAFRAFGKTRKPLPLGGVFLSGRGGQ